MDTRKLGKNGPSVSALGLGCMGMTGIYGEPNEAESIATIHRAIDLGVDLIVTSDAYGAGNNEELVGRAIKGRRSRVLLATKFGNVGLSGFKLPEGLSAGHPAYVPQACEASLKRLGVEVIDIYGLHRGDPRGPIEGTVGAMEKLVGQGQGRPPAPFQAGAAAPRRPPLGACRGGRGAPAARARGAPARGARARVLAGAARREKGHPPRLPRARDRFYGLRAPWPRVPYGHDQDAGRAPAEG